MASACAVDAEEEDEDDEDEEEEEEDDGSSSDPSASSASRADAGRLVLDEDDEYRTDGLADAEAVGGEAAPRVARVDRSLLSAASDMADAVGTVLDVAEIGHGNLVEKE